MATAVLMQHVSGMNVSANRDLLEMGNTVKVIYKVIIKKCDENRAMKWKLANKTETTYKRTGSRAIWLVYPTDTNARGFWLVKRTLGWKNFILENFLEINRYFALTSYCNTIGQSKQCILHIRIFWPENEESMFWFFHPLADKTNNEH